MNRSAVIWIGFFLATFMAVLQSALFPQVAFFAYAPFFSLLCLHASFASALWMAAMAGLALDFFSSEPFGLHAMAAAIAVALLHRFGKNIFKDQLLQLCATTAMVSLLLSCIEPLLYFLFDRRMPFAGQSMLVDCFIMPLVDAAYAFIWFTAPLQLLEWATYRIKLWRFKKYGSA